MLECLFKSFNEHPLTWFAGAGYFFVAAINTLPEPGSDKPVRVQLYQWLFDFMHVISNRVVQKLPSAAVAPAPAPQQFIHTFATAPQAPTQVK